MTTKRFPIYIDIINLILALIVIASVDMLISVGMGKSCTAYEILAFLAVMVWSYLLRELVAWLWLYIPLNAVMFLLCTMSGQPDLARVKVGIVVLLFALLNISYWTSGRDGTMDIHYGIVGVVAVAYIYCSQKDHVEAAGVLYALCVCYVLLEMLKKLLENYHEIALSGQLTDDMPVREIFRNNSIGAIGIMVLVIMTMILVKAEGLIAWIKSIWFKLASGIGTLFKVDFDIEEKTQEVQTIQYGSMPPVQQEDNLLTRILDILEIALYVAAVVILIYGFVKLLIYIVRYLMRRDLGNREYRTFSDERETRERIRRVENDSEEGFGLFKTPKEKIRNIYRKKLRNLKKSGSDIRETMTPRENSSSALKNNHDITDATAMYEYVRYSANPVTTKEDVARFKQLIK